MSDRHVTLDGEDLEEVAAALEKPGRAARVEHMTRHGIGSRRRSAWLPAALSAVVATGCAHARSTQPHEVQLSPYVGRLRTVSVRGGDATGAFLLDTGGGITVIDSAAARRFGCAARGSVSGFRMSGERIRLEGCGPVQLHVGAATLQAEAGILDLATLLPPPEFPRIDGILALQTFASRRVTLDLGGDRIWFETPGSLAHRVRSMRPLSVRAQRDLAGAGLELFVEVRGARGPLWFLVDSGNLDDVLVSPHAAEELADEAGQARLRAGERTEVDLELTGFDLGRVVVRQRDLIYDGVLNAAALERFVLALDLVEVRAWASWR